MITVELAAGLVGESADTFPHFVKCPFFRKFVALDDLHKARDDSGEIELSGVFHWVLNPGRMRSAACVVVPGLSAAEHGGMHTLKTLREVAYINRIRCEIKAVGAMTDEKRWRRHWPRIERRCADW